MAIPVPVNRNRCILISPINRISDPGIRPRLMPGRKCGLWIAKKELQIADYVLRIANKKTALLFHTISEEIFQKF